MRNILKVSLAATFVLVLFAIVSVADDSDAKITLSHRVFDGEPGVQYDLCYNDNPGTDYGKTYVAFVTGGNIASGNKNCYYSATELIIQPYIYHNGKTYEVVGIRNNAFQASLTPERYTEAIETVLLPWTLQKICVGTDYTTVGAGHSFSGCTGLKEVRVYSNIYNVDAALSNIGSGAFNNCESLEELDLYYCTALTGLPTLGLTGVKEIVMPHDPAVAEMVANTLSLDFGGLSPAEYAGKAFKLDGGVMKTAKIATFDTLTSEGVDELVCFPGESLPSATRDNCQFLGWYNGGTLYTTMPDSDMSFESHWRALSKPDDSKIYSFTYNGYDQSPFSSNGAYTVTGGTAKNAGSYKAVITLNPNTVWADDTTDTLNISWTINKAILTATYHGERITVGHHTAELKVDVTGFLGNDNEGNALGYVAPYIDKDSVPTDPGYYSLTPQGGAADNYDFTYVSGELQIAEGFTEEEVEELPIIAIVALLTVYMIASPKLIKRKKI